LELDDPYGLQEVVTGIEGEPFIAELLEGGVALSEGIMWGCL